MTRLLVLVGGGGHAKVVFDAAVGAGFAVAGFLDDDANAPLGAMGVRHLGRMREWAEHESAGALMPAIGDNATRCELMLGMLEGRSTDAMATVIHASAVISRRDVSIGAGTFVGPGAIVNPGSRIGAGVIINSGAIIEHDVVIGDWSHVGPGAALGGAVEVENQALIGLGCRILPGRHVGRESIVGAGAVVTRDVAPQTAVRGNPARED